MDNRAYRVAFALACIAVFTAGKAAAPVMTGEDIPLPAEDEWRFLPFEERHSEMTFLVHPTLMERWQAFYRTDAPMLRCVSCHGENAERDRYQIAKTPIDDLKPSRVRALYVPGAKLSAEQKFKRDEITPLMARLLGVPQYDPATGLGFSCFGCHPREAE